jgi:CRP-like cAMP-binding protein
MPRHVPASVTELSRIGLLAELPGELLTKLAARMNREELGPGAPIVTEGEGGERFYVVLAGMLSVTQAERGLRRILKPGDYFGEVALTMDIPRTASIYPMTPVTLASCDRETFDEFIRPLFAEEGSGQPPSDSS